MNQYKIKSLFLLIVSVMAVGSCSPQNPFKNQLVDFDFDGPAMHVRPGHTSYCIGRRFLEPHDLILQRKRSGPIVTDDLFQPFVESVLFSEELTGYSNAHYSDGFPFKYDKTFYPRDWVRITLLPEYLRREKKYPQTELKSGHYNTDSTVDHGFRTHQGKEGMELRYGHAAAKEILLKCNSKRCFVENDMEVGGGFIYYDFPRYMLRNWPRLHFKILSRVMEWRSNQSCYWPTWANFPFHLTQEPFK